MAREDGRLTICRCEEITEDEIRRAIQEWAIRDLNELKLITRAGKGSCQGRTCMHLLARILAEATGQPLSALRPWTARIPVRPLPALALPRTGSGPSPSGVTLTMMEVTDEDRHIREEGGNP